VIRSKQIEQVIVRVLSNQSLVSTTGLSRTVSKEIPSASRAAIRQSLKYLEANGAVENIGDTTAAWKLS
jgi:Fe2+ or Zn2+ uptake regulation protein